MLVINSSEKWRVQGERVPSFVYRIVFSGVSLMVLQSQFIGIGSSRFVISLLKEVSRENVGSKLQLILIPSISVSFFLYYGLGNRRSQPWVKDVLGLNMYCVHKRNTTEYFPLAVYMFTC